jgi:hypothetical protein
MAHLYPELCESCGSWVWHRRSQCSCVDVLCDTKRTVMTTHDLVGKLVFCRGGNYFYVGTLVSVNESPTGLTLSPHRVVYDIQDKPYNNKRGFGALGKIAKNPVIISSVETVEEVEGTIEKPEFKE